ncbi:hypothetical protein ACFFJT_08830 [Dyella flava]|uniref:Uncharacterized protein n=1 Tax=Dyella flava TaxID=1920170 RepID=A0ABS2K906_9GAMM|nr:hypothetical protein [Dyella flava]MBM7127695.1 hypothetical protein [Dyella flava]GLQ51294.1 hypothetical protein GCM10010872_27430 [Dyella flava]
MNQAIDKSHVEAWKAVIDFVKTIISISSAILTAFVGYYALNQIPIGESCLNFVSPFFLLASIVVALFGFGRSIKAISSGISQEGGVLFTNISAYCLLVGILAVPLISTGSNKSLDKVLADIDRMPPVSGIELKQDAVQKIVVDGQNYIITYAWGNAGVIVTYSEKEGRVIKFERQQITQPGKP